MAKTAVRAKQALPSFVRSGIELTKRASLIGRTTGAYPHWEDGAFGKSCNFQAPFENHKIGISQAYSGKSVFGKSDFPFVISVHTRE